MKIITIKQPWATLIAEGYKKYEFRTWKTNYHGEILIHAGKGIDADAMDRFVNLGLDYPLSRIVAKATIIDCILLTPTINNEINSESNIYGTNLNRVGYAWELTDIVKLNIEDKVSGKLGIWNIERDDL